MDRPVRRRRAPLLPGELGLGGLMQTTGAFQQVQDALSFFVQSYKEIAAWSSVVERLAGFERALEHVHLQAASGGGVRRAEGGATHLTVEGVDLYLPDGQPLMANVNLSLLRGDTVLLGGASGSGKSTLVRAIAGIWPFGRGEIRAPLDARILFLPQRPYLPIGTLRDVVSYPMPAGVSTMRHCARRSRPWAPGARRAPRRGRDTGRSSSPRRAAAHRLRTGPGPEARLALPRRGDLGGGRGDGGAPLSAGARAARKDDGVQHRPSGDAAPIPRAPARGAARRERPRIHRGSARPPDAGPGHGALRTDEGTAKPR